MATVALRHNTLGQLGIVELALRHNALRHNLLSEIALRHNTWENLLPTEAPLQTLTFGDAAAINPGAVGALTLEDIDLSSTALRHNSLGAFVLGKRPALGGAGAGRRLVLLPREPAVQLLERRLPSRRPPCSTSSSRATTFPPITRARSPCSTWTWAPARTPRRSPASCCAR